MPQHVVLKVGDLLWEKCTSRCKCKGEGKGKCTANGKGNTVSRSVTNTALYLLHLITPTIETSYGIPNHQSGSVRTMYPFPTGKGDFHVECADHTVLWSNLKCLHPPTTPPTHLLSPKVPHSDLPLSKSEK